MGIDAEQLEKDADAELAQLMGLNDPAPAPQDKQAPTPVAADELPPPDPQTQSEPSVHSEPVQAEPEVAPPAPDVNENWQDKYLKAEESRKNAQALMTQATQKAAELERRMGELQQQLTAMQTQASQAPEPAPSPQPVAGQFDDLREDYQELDPVFKTLEATTQQNQELQQRLAAIEDARKQQEQTQAQQQFWDAVRQHHADVDEVSASPDFQGWFARQSPDVQQLSQVSPLGAATVMTQYKQSIATASPSKIQQAQGLSEPQVRTRSQPTTHGQKPVLTLEQIAALPQAEYEKNEAEYDRMLNQHIRQGGR